LELRPSSGYRDGGVAYDDPTEGEGTTSESQVSMTWNLPSPVHTYVPTSPSQRSRWPSVTLERVSAGHLHRRTRSGRGVRPNRSNDIRRSDWGPTHKLYRNVLALPRGSPGSTARFLNDPAAILERTTGRWLRPTAEVVLEGAAPLSGPQAKAPISSKTPVTRIDGVALAREPSQEPGNTYT